MVRKSFLRVTFRQLTSSNVSFLRVTHVRVTPAWRAGFLHFPPRLDVLPPRIFPEHIWQWMAKQSLKHGHPNHR